VRGRENCRDHQRYPTNFHERASYPEGTRNEILKREQDTRKRLWARLVEENPQGEQAEGKALKMDGEGQEGM
jgi:hypothetical protein